MRGEPNELIDGTRTRRSELDSDWQGVLVGATIAPLVELIGADSPW
jgi:hypothetical protein